MEPGLGQDNYYGTGLFQCTFIKKAMLFSLSPSFFPSFSFFRLASSSFPDFGSVGRSDEKKRNLLKNPLQKKKKERKKV